MRDAVGSQILNLQMCVCYLFSKGTEKGFQILLLNLIHRNCTLYILPTVQLVDYLWYG